MPWCMLSCCTKPAHGAASMQRHAGHALDMDSGCRLGEPHSVHLMPARCAACRTSAQQCMSAGSSPQVGPCRPAGTPERCRDVLCGSSNCPSRIRTRVCRGQYCCRSMACWFAPVQAAFVHCSSSPGQTSAPARPMTVLVAAALQAGLLCTLRHSSALSYTLHTCAGSSAAFRGRQGVQTHALALPSQLAGEVHAERVGRAPRQRCGLGGR